MYICAENIRGDVHIMEGGRGGGRGQSTVACGGEMIARREDGRRADSRTDQGGQQVVCICAENTRGDVHLMEGAEGVGEVRASGRGDC